MSNISAAERHLRVFMAERRARMSDSRRVAPPCGLLVWMDGAVQGSKPCAKCRDTWVLRPCRFCGFCSGRQCAATLVRRLAAPRGVITHYKHTYMMACACGTIMTTESRAFLSSRG